MTKTEILERLIKQKEPTVAELVDENHSLRAKKRVAYAGLALLTAFGALTGHYAVKTTKDLNKARQENKTLTENVNFYQKNTLHLSERVMNLSDFANDAQMLANSMIFYPDMPDSISALDEKDQEKAEKEFEKQNQKAQAEHDKALKTLGVDKDLLLRLQQGPKLYE